MVPRGSPVAKKMQAVLEAEAAKASHTMLPIYEENGVYNFYLKMGARGSVTALDQPAQRAPESLEHGALVGLVKDLQRQVTELQSSFQRLPARSV